MMDQLDCCLAFIGEAELLKSVLRTSWLSTGRRESTAEHSWRLALLAAVLLEEYPQLDKTRVLTMCLVHDLGELYDGDVSAALLPDEAKKYKDELRAVRRLFSLLPPTLGEKFQGIWQEYEDATTGEARFVKALDKAETILQHNRGKNPSDFDYEFNLQYGKKYFEDNALLSKLREKLDEGTREKARQNGMTVGFCDSEENRLPKYVVIVSRYQGKWVYCKHRDRDTYECPGGHREEGETAEEAARRELWEETGAKVYELTSVGDYFTKGGEEDGGEVFGSLFFAEIEEFGEMPDFEIEKTVLFEEEPERLTYPKIQPYLLEKVREKMGERIE